MTTGLLLAMCVAFFVGLPSLIIGAVSIHVQCGEGVMQLPVFLLVGGVVYLVSFLALFVLWNLAAFGKLDPFKILISIGTVLIIFMIVWSGIGASILSGSGACISVAYNVYNMSLANVIISFVAIGVIIIVYIFDI